MTPRLTALAAATMAAAALAPAAMAAPLSKAIQFRALNQNVSCGVEIHAPSQPASTVLCQALGIPGPKHGGIGDPAVQISVLGKAQLLRVSQASLVGGRVARLGRGRLWNRLGVTCHVAQTTVMCFNGDNHGFVIGNGRYKSF